MKRLLAAASTKATCHRLERVLSRVRDGPKPPNIGLDGSETKLTMCLFGRFLNIIACVSDDLDKSTTGPDFG